MGSTFDGQDRFGHDDVELALHSKRTPDEERAAARKAMKDSELAKAKEQREAAMLSLQVARKDRDAVAKSRGLANKLAGGYVTDSSLSGVLGAIAGHAKVAADSSSNTSRLLYGCVLPGVYGANTGGAAFPVHASPWRRTTRWIRSETMKRTCQMPCRTCVR